MACAKFNGSLIYGSELGQTADPDRCVVAAIDVVYEQGEIMFKEKLVRSAVALALIATPASVAVTGHGWAQVGNIVVTTRKREESLQDVPLSVSAFGAIQIQQRGIQDISDVAKLTAGIEFDEGYGAQDTRVTIRGLSQTRGRPNAALLIDGIDFTGEALSTVGGSFSFNRRLLDTERIEVVKGPQSALYGRSAFGGAVQFITRTPSMDEFEVEGGFDISTKDDYEFNVSAGGPVVEDILALRLNALYWDEDGYYDSSLTGETVGGGDGWGLAGTVLFEPTESISAKVRIAYSEDEYEVAAQARVPANTIQPLPYNLVSNVAPFPFGIIFGFYRTYPDCSLELGLPDTDVGTIATCYSTPRTLVTGNIGNADGLAIVQSPNPRTGMEYPGTALDTLQITSKVDWDVGIGTITSYTGFLDSNSEEMFDSTWDALPAGMHGSLDGSWEFTLAPCGFADCSPIAQEIDFRNNTQLFSQELRFASDFDGPFQVTVGGNFWNEDSDQFERSITVSHAIFRGFTNLAALPPAGAVIPTALVKPRNKGRETTHWSAYTLLEWDISEQFKVSFEGRYVDEKVDVLGVACDGPATEAETGFASSDLGVDLNGDGVIENTGPESVPDGIRESCHADFRGGSSFVTVGSGGTVPAGTVTNAVTVPLTVTSNESYFTPKGTFEWTPADNQLYYFSVARAVKPGGISSLTPGTFFDPANVRFDSEKLMVYEIGAKTTWLDGSLVLNGAAYFQKFSDKQVGTTQFDSRIQTDTGAIENAGEADIYGIELESVWQVTEEITMGAAYSFIDAEYTSFMSKTGSATEVARLIAAGKGGCLGVTDLDPRPNEYANVCDVDRTGNRIEDIPKHAFVGTGEYRAPLNILGGWMGQDFDWFLQTSVVYTGERFVDPNNAILLDSYITADFRIGVTSENVDLLVYIDNAFDNDTIKSGLEVGTQVGPLRQGSFPPGPTDGFIANLPDPRVVGFRGRFRF